MPSSSDREVQFRQMRETAREMFQFALDEASISKAVDRHVHCQRGLLRVCEDLYDLQSYARTLVVSIGKAGHTMVEALAGQVGASLEGIVASSVEPAAQVHGFRYFRGGHPPPKSQSIQAAIPVRRGPEDHNGASLGIFLVSGGG